MVNRKLVPREDSLLRRVYRKDKRYVKKDGSITSRAFAPRPKDEGKLSVDVERLTSYAKSIKDPEKFMLYKIEAAIPYDLGLSCFFEPEPDNPAHAIIVGFEEDDESVPGILARQAIKIDYP